MANILDKIFADKKEELATTQIQVPLPELKGRIGDRRDILDFTNALRGEGETHIIAEIKRRTPFKGELVESFDAMAIAKAYEENRASALSILTESRHFGGSLEYLSGASGALKIPLLRKDFIFAEYQVYEALAYGADAFLLIATSLDKNQLKDLRELGLELGLTALVETHDERDLERALYAGTTLLGVNNRDLTTGKTDLDISRRLIRETSGMDHLTLVCESGIKGRDEIEEFEKIGMHAFLVGETLMKANSIPDKLKELTGHARQAAG